MRGLARGDRLVIATHNPGKLIEIAALLHGSGLDVTSVAALGLHEPEETAPDCYGNARLKALHAAHASGLPALADDSGFCVAALDGAPGVLSARWANGDFGAAMARVHTLSEGHHDPRAWFICALSLAWPDGRTRSFLGRVDGTHVWPPRGRNGFGYDPIFVPAGSSRTYGEMTLDEKEADSHRARAFAQLG